MLVAMILILILTFYIAWSIGTNDETMAAPVGCGALKINIALILGGTLATIGAYVMGKNVSETIGEKLWQAEITQTEIITVLLAMAIWLTIASYRELPVSTTHSIIGTIIGLAFITTGINSINIGTLMFIFSGWILSPILGFVFAYVFHKLIMKLITTKFKGLREIERFEKISSYLLIIVVSFTAFSRGANDVANAVGILSKAYALSFSYLLLWGGIGMATGLLTLGRRVVKTVGMEITEMRPSTALSAQLSTMLVLFFGTFFGFPLSGTQILVAAIIGVGLVEKRKIKKETIRDIVYSWILTLPASALIGIIIYPIIGLAYSLF
ncbi:MAG: inorganic phosphate transporter [Candidatus Asgardarchaeia archaeon]